MFRSLRITFLGKSRVIVDKNPNFIFYQSCGITIFSCIVLRVLVGKRLMISMSHLKGLDFTEEDWECSWIFWNPAWRDPRRTILKRDLELIGGSVGKSGRLNGFTLPPSHPLLRYHPFITLRMFLIEWVHFTTVSASSSHLHFIITLATVERWGWAARLTIQCIWAAPLPQLLY